MFDRFSIPARRTIFWALAEARRCGASAIEPKHLLFGFLMEDQGESESRLSRRSSQDRGPSASGPRDEGQPFFSSEDANRLRHTPVGEIPAFHKSDPGGLPFSDEVQSVLGAAIEKANGFEVEMAHLLSALSNSEVPPIKDLKADNGVQWERVEEIIRRRNRNE